MDSSTPDHQTNSLEDALHAASNDVTATGPFYATLLQSDVVILGEVTDGEVQPDGSIPPGAKVALGHQQFEDGTPFVPVFTSNEEIIRLGGEGVKTLTVPARALLELTAGTVLVLNPGSDDAKILMPDEVRQALSGGGLSEVHTDPDREITLGLPATDPVALEAALTTVFERHPAVTSAYYCQVDMNDGTKPHLLVGVDGSGEVVEAIKDAGATAQRLPRDGGVVDFADMSQDNSGIGDYLRESGVKFYSTDE